MTALYKEPGKAPELIDVGNSLRALQHLVHGYIEAVPVFGDIVLLCNEEGLINDMPYNISLQVRDRYTQIFGPLLLVGTDKEEFCDLPEPEWWLEQFEGTGDLRV